MSVFLKEFFWLVITLGLLVPLTVCRGESAGAGNPLGYLAGAPIMPQDDWGRIRIPASVLSYQRQNRIPPMLEFVLLNTILNSGLKKALSATPPEGTPYLEAVDAWKDGECFLRKAFMTAFLVSTLSQAPAGPGGGASLPSLLLGGFQKDGNCEDGGSSNGFDPALLAVIGKH